MTAQPFIRRQPSRVWNTLVAIALLASASLAAAGTYDVRHNFSLRPGGNVVPQVQAVYYAHAWARTFKPDCSDWDVQPPAATQPVGWGPFGDDRLLSRGRVRHRDSPNTVQATLARVNVGAGGMAQTTWTADAQGCASAKAQANSEITVNAFGAGTPVTGTIRAHGFATATAPPPRRSQSYAFSMAMVEARGGRLMRNGTIRWGKVVRDVVSGKTTARRQVDPIEFAVTNLVTSQVFTGSLYSVEVDIPASPFGGFVWENDQVEITASNLMFRVAFESTNTSLQGELLIEVGGGVVTNAVGTGHYAGVAPAIGSGLPLNLALPNEIEFDYDLGDHNGDDLDVGIDFSGAGETAEEAESDIPWLTLTSLDDTTVTVEYFATESPWMLESSPALSPGAPWTEITVPPLQIDDRVVYQLLRSPTETGQFFRLRKDDQPDTEPPTFQVHPECGGPYLIVEFSEPVTPQTAQDPLNYQITSQPIPPMPIGVMQVQMLSPQMVGVQLSQPLTPGPIYELRVQGVSDLAGNVMPPTTVTFDCNQATD